MNMPSKTITIFAFLMEFNQFSFVMISTRCLLLTGKDDAALGNGRNTIMALSSVQLTEELEVDSLITIGAITHFRLHSSVWDNGEVLRCNLNEDELEGKYDFGIIYQMSSK